ncbi:hypothetical protein B0I37DRAFT_206409 [Chaetomium sp. MPI-CAGE-AT-0009]|nr:hypothetical protein B0I37DRAFT_206409 [Chaetomium sp. MPI-CAGE-AT-0009]
MDPDEETKRMLPAAQPVPMSDVEINERTATLGSSHDDHPEKEVNDVKTTVATAYGRANYYAALRWLFSAVILGCSASIVARGSKPTTSWIALPWAAYCVACATLHVLLAPHRATQPRRGSLLPGRAYLGIIAASMALLLLAIAGGAVVVHLTKSHMDDRDRSGGMTAWCGKGRRKCYPYTPEAAVFALSCVCLGFASVAFLCSLMQCYGLFRLSRTVYTEEDEVQLASSGPLQDSFSTKLRKGWEWKK